MKNNTIKIQKTLAEEQLKLFTDFYDIDMDFIPVDTQNAVELCTLGVTKHIMRGRLEIIMEDTGVVVIQHLTHPVGDLEMLKYGVVGGVARRESDNADGHNSRIDYLLGSMSKGGSAEIAKLIGVDRSAAECVANLFFVV